MSKLIGLTKTARPIGDTGHGVRPRFRIDMLGGFELTAGPASIELPMPAKRLLAVLALHEKPLLRTYVAGLLWPDVTDERARGNLRSTIWRLGAAQRLVDGRALLSLHRDVQVDVAVVTRTARQVIAEESAPPAGALETLSTSRELLPDWYDEWLVFERERLDQLRVLALECLVQRLLARRRIAEATMAAMAAVRIDPYRESSQQLLIECHVAQGNRGAALRQFRAYASMLKRELALEPPSTISARLAALAGA